MRRFLELTLIEILTNGITRQQKLQDIHEKKPSICILLPSTFIVPKLCQSVQDILDRVLKCFETSNYELEILTKSIEIRYLLLNVTTRRETNNNITGVVSVTQGVIDVIQHDRAVDAMANELRLLIDSANAPIFGIDVSGTVTEWNDKTAEITGYSREEAMDKPLISTLIVVNLCHSVQK